MEAYFDFEKPIAALEKKLEDLRELSRQGGVDLKSEIHGIEKKLNQLVEETYTKLNPWQRVQIARHPNRPYALDYIETLFPSFQELKGDRFFGDDEAIVGGIAEWKSKKGAHSLMIIAHQKGRSTKEKMARNFGMAKPEGYRKAMRLMSLADKARMPILTLIDTPGAYPGIEAEERGQSEAIASSIQRMFSLKVPVVSIVIGEGGSGGALAIGCANKVLMMEFSTYSVISPESCASILWSDSKLAEQASEKLKMNPSDLLRLGVIDDVIPEPKGGAHRDWKGAARLLEQALHKHLDPLLGGERKTPMKRIQDERIRKFRLMGNQALARIQ